MFVKHLLPALVAIGSVAAQSSCRSKTTNINSQDDVSKIGSCRTVEGSVILGTQTGASIDLMDVQEITGDLIIRNNGQLENLQGSRLRSIGGKFEINNATGLNVISLGSLTSVSTIEWVSVTRLDTLTLGPLTKADSIRLSDTFLNTLDAFALETVTDLKLDNNRRLSKYSSQLTNVEGQLIVQANGLSLELDFPKLDWAYSMAIANVTKFSIPQLQVVNDSARFDSNFFESFSAPNLTHTEKGDISFVGNGFLKNMSFPKLTAINGGLLIANNTGLDRVTFFPKLEKVTGAIKLRGNFTEISFPALENVEGAVDISSTADIRESCEELAEAAPRNQGGDGRIAGTFTCTANNENANEDTDDSANGSGQIDGTDDEEDSAAGVALNSALFGLVAVAAVAVAL